jgi:hypothetical protein
VPLRLKDLEQLADARVAGRVGQLGPHLGSGGVAAAVQHVHDLPLAAGQNDVNRVRHGGLGKRRMC